MKNYIYLMGLIFTLMLLSASPPTKQIENDLQTHFNVGAEMPGFVVIVPINDYVVFDQAVATLRYEQSAELLTYDGDIELVDVIDDWPQMVSLNNSTISKLPGKNIKTHYGSINRLL